jgi:haloalkane dehalogenase
MQVQIRVKNHLNSDWQEWLEGLAVVHEPSWTTLLCGWLRDQAELYGVLLKIHDFGVTLLSLETSEASPT